MLKTKFFVLAVMTALIAAACAPFTPPPLPTPVIFPPTPTDSAPMQGMAVVTGVEIRVAQNSPLQVTAIVRGQLPDAGCTSIFGVQQSRIGNAFQIVVGIITEPEPGRRLVETDIRSETPTTFSVIPVERKSRYILLQPVT